MPGGSSVIGNQTIVSRMVALTQSSVDVTTSQTTTSTSYTDLATTGPAVTLSSGVTQTNFLLVSATQGNTSGGFQNYASVAVNGATALDVDSYQGWTLGSDSVREGLRAVVAASQASGNTHTMKYRVNGGTNNVSNRRLIGLAA